MVHPHVWTRSLTLPFTVILPFQPQMNRLPLIPSQAISHTTPHSWFISHLDCWKSVFHCSPWLQDLPVLLCLLLFLFSHSVMYNSLWLPWTKTHQGSLSFTISQSLIKLMSTESVMPSNHLILCCHRLLLPSIFPSIRVFSNEPSLHIRWPKYWSFSFNISPANEYSGLIFRIDWFDLLAVQETLQSLLQHHSSKASIFWCSAFFLIVQLSHPYMTIGKTIALTRWTFVGKVVSLIFNMLSRLVIAFLPRSKCLNFIAAVTSCSDFRAQENSLSLFPHLFAMKWWDWMRWY